MLVYLIVNLVNGKRYVGQTRNPLKTRIDQHFYHAIHKPQCPVDYAIRKYGADQFYFRKLRDCQTRAELNYYEEYYIRFLGTLVPKGYNVLLPSKPHPSAIRKQLRDKLVLDRYYQQHKESLPS